LNHITPAKVWHKLPDQFIHATSTNAFKNRLDKYWESEEIYYSDHRAEISGGNRSDIQLPDIDIIGESGEVEPRGASSGNRILMTSLVSSNSSYSLLWVTLSITSSMWSPLNSLFEFFIAQTVRASN
jgi:hypothetical protein